MYRQLEHGIEWYKFRIRQPYFIFFSVKSIGVVSYAAISTHTHKFKHFMHQVKIEQKQQQQQKKLLCKYFEITWTAPSIFFTDSLLLCRLFASFGFVFFPCSDSSLFPSFGFLILPRFCFLCFFFVLFRMSFTLVLCFDYACAVL